MAYRIMKQIQTQLNVPGDTTTHVIVYMECDTLADLPASPTAISGLTLEISSRAHIIQDNTRYCMQADGTWKLQDQSPFSDVYTKSQVDSLLNDIDSTIATEESTRRLQIAALIDSGAKNRLDVFQTASQTINNVVWTINADGTVTANGLASANSFLYLIPNNSNIAYGVETFISGCPAGGSANTYEIQVSQTGGTTYHDYGDGESIPSDYVYRYFVCCVRNGYNANDLIFRPMICDTWKYVLTPTFVPYSPTNAELAALIRQFHP